MGSYNIFGLKAKIIAVLFLSSITWLLTAQTNYPNNEDGKYQDMLTPEYYNTPSDGAFRDEVNKLVHFARQIPFQHPFSDSFAYIPKYTIGRSFGDGIGPGGTRSHHPAFDYYLEGAITNVNLYAACDGFVKIDKTVSRYRHFLSISSEVKDSFGTVIGKVLVIYAHIELDLDAAENLNLNGKFVNKGDLVSKHLYSGTVGGPHLHFEIRYYRPTDLGDEDFYGGLVGDKTTPSAGSWTSGYWNPNSGYGYAHPLNHLNQINTGTSEINFYDDIKVFPNPVKDYLTITKDNKKGNTLLTILNMKGSEIFRQHLEANAYIDFRNYEKGIYLVNISKGNDKKSIKIFKE